MRTRATKKPFDANERMESLGAVVGQFKHFRPAPEVIREIRAVRTIFPQYDAATRIGGHPIERISLVHGPSNEGKTVFTHGLGLSFLRSFNFYALVDAERTNPPDWLKTLLGTAFKSPGFVALPSSSYEQTVDAVADFCEVVAKARATGKVHADTTGLVVVDSLRKLVPKNFMAKLEKGADKSGVDGFGGRAGQIRAALNSAWMDQLVPLMADSGMSIVLISRETDDPNAGMFDEGIVVGGGKAVFYDSALAIRITRKFIKHPDEKKAERGIHIGERHRLQIRKTKVAKKEEKYPIGYFHTSNGLWAPEGFDRARDVFDFALRRDVVKRTGSWYSFEGVQIGQGEHKSVQTLIGDPELLQAIEDDVRRSDAREDESEEDDDE